MNQQQQQQNVFEIKQINIRRKKRKESQEAPADLFQWLFSKYEEIEIGISNVKKEKKQQLKVWDYEGEERYFDDYFFLNSSHGPLIYPLKFPRTRGITDSFSRNIHCVKNYAY